MKEILLVRIAGVSALLAVIVQFGAMGLAVSHGIQPGGIPDLSDPARLLELSGNSGAGVLGLALATLSPTLALPLGLGLYVVLKQARGYTLFGAVFFYIGMSIALVHEVLRIVLFWKLPTAYADATEAARPAVIAFGSVLQAAQEMFNLIAFVTMFGLGFSAFALSILRLRTLPRWLGWVLLVPSIGAGLICVPLGYLGVSTAGMLVLPEMLVFFIWLTATGVYLLRWQETRI